MGPAPDPGFPVKLLLLSCSLVARFRGGLVFKAHRRLHHSTLGLRVVKKKKKHLIKLVEPLFLRADRIRTQKTVRTRTWSRLSGETTQTLSAVRSTLDRTNILDASFKSSRALCRTHFVSDSEYGPGKYIATHGWATHLIKLVEPLFLMSNMAHIRQPGSEYGTDKTVKERI